MGNNNIKPQENKNLQKMNVDHGWTQQRHTFQGNIQKPQQSAFFLSPMLSPSPMCALFKKKQVSGVDSTMICYYRFGNNASNSNNAPQREKILSQYSSHRTRRLLPDSHCPSQQHGIQHGPDPVEGSHFPDLTSSVTADTETSSCSVNTKKKGYRHQQCLIHGENKASTEPCVIIDSSCADNSGFSSSTNGYKDEICDSDRNLKQELVPISLSSQISCTESAIGEMAEADQCSSDLHYNALDSEVHLTERGGSSAESNEGSRQHEMVIGASKNDNADGCLFYFNQRTGEFHPLVFGSVTREGSSGRHLTGNFSKIQELNSHENGCNMMSDVSWGTAPFSRDSSRDLISDTSMDWNSLNKSIVFVGSVGSLNDSSQSFSSVLDEARTFCENKVNGGPRLDIKSSQLNAEPETHQVSGISSISWSNYRQRAATSHCESCGIMDARPLFGNHGKVCQECYMGLQSIAAETCSFGAMSNPMYSTQDNPNSWSENISQHIQNCSNSNCLDSWTDRIRDLCPVGCSHENGSCSDKDGHESESFSNPNSQGCVRLCVGGDKGEDIDYCEIATEGMDLGDMLAAYSGPKFGPLFPKQCQNIMRKQLWAEMEHRGTDTGEFSVHNMDHNADACGAMRDSRAFAAGFDTSHSGPITAEFRPSRSGPITAEFSPSHSGPITAEFSHSHSGPITAEFSPSHSGPITAEFSPSHSGPITAEFSPSHSGPITTRFSRPHSGPITAGFSRSHNGPITSEFSPSHNGPITAEFSRSHNGPITTPLHSGPITAEFSRSHNGPITAEFSPSHSPQTKSISEAKALLNDETPAQATNLLSDKAKSNNSLHLPLSQPKKPTSVSALPAASDRMFMKTPGNNACSKAEDTPEKYSNPSKQTSNVEHKDVADQVPLNPVSSDSHDSNSQSTETSPECPHFWNGFASDSSNPFRHNYAAYLCCAPDDLSDFGLSFHRELESWGFRIFIAPRDLELTGPKYENMTRWLEDRCNEKMIVILSKNYERSDECLFMTHFARTLDPDSRNRNIIPVLIDKVEIPNVLKGLSVIKYNYDFRCGWLKKKLADAILAEKSVKL